MTYAEKLKHPKWQKKRLQVLERDGWVCRDCLTDSESLQVHHCFYEKGDPWETDDRFLITVCDECHKSRQRDEYRIKKMVCSRFSNLTSAAIKRFADTMENEGFTVVMKHEMDRLSALDTSKIEVNA